MHIRFRDKNGLKVEWSETIDIAFDLDKACPFSVQTFVEKLKAALSLCLRTLGEIDGSRKSASSLFLLKNTSPVVFATLAAFRKV